MRLAIRATVAALTLLVLCALVSAQTLRSEGDPRNTSPTVGTGGPPGGPTGLFTIYDGQTLRRGEYTFSIAYSNFDRDPGNVDITEIPTSFQIGLNDRIELFFNTDAYRGVKVNSPQNLSSFYLPNSQLYFGAGLSTLRSGAAIVLAPHGPGAGTIGLTAIYRPAGNQPFAQFPYTGASAGNFGFTGLTNAQIGALFGFSGGLPTLGPPISAGGGGNYGRADLFPGVGSAFGGILPGIAFSSAIRTCGAAATPCNIVPAAFTVAPVYLPDAPFVNRLYGQTAFSTFTIGAKIRFNSTKDSWGWGVIPFYRFYADKADDAGGFNQLQRGASPGGSIGDFGAVLFADARLSRSVNVSGNLGMIFNSNPKGTFPNGDFVLLDRPNEILAGVGFDFPVTRYFQPMIEVRSQQYVGGRTPNAFQQNPFDVVAGFKAYPRRWMGFGVAWRYNVNQQDKQSFSNNGARNVTLAATTGPGANTNATTFSVVADGVPAGFVPSDNANGFIFQFWVGRRNKRVPDELPNHAPVVHLAGPDVVALPCRQGYKAGDCGTARNADLTATATDEDGDTLLYTYNVTGGTVNGSGANASWDLSNVQPGRYTATVEVNDGCGCISWDTKTIEVVDCCIKIIECPIVTVSCPTDPVQAGSSATVSASVTQGDPNKNYSLSWSVSGGTISGGQGTSTITVDTAGVDGDITATAQIVDCGPECTRCVASCTFPVVGKPVAKKFDEYGKLKRNDEKARLDNFVIELNRNPDMQGYVITYGGRVGPAGEAAARGEFVRKYMVDTRGFDTNRLTIVPDGYKEEAWTELWLVPKNADNPVDSHTVDPSEVKTSTGRTPRRRGRH